MSEASNRTFAAEQRYRERRMMAKLQNPGFDGVLPAPEWDAFYGSLSDRRDEAHAQGLNFRADTPRAGGRPSLARMGSDDGIALNQYLADMQDDRRARAQSLRAMTASADIGEAAAREAQVPMQDKAAVDRAFALSRSGAGVLPGAIVKSDDGSYASRGEGPIADPRDVFRAELPGRLQPVEKPVTFEAPKPVMVGDKRVFGRMGSDGLMYDMSRKPIDPTKLAPETTGDRSGASDGKILSGVPDNFKSVIGRVLVNAPATRRKAIEDGFAQVWATGNEAELKDQIRNAAIQTEDVETKKQVLGRMATKASLDDASAIMKEMQAKGVPTGFFTGTVEDLVRKVGKTTNPEYVALANRLQGTLINYRRAATGAAFGEREGAAYEKMFPNYRNDLPVNMALIEGLQREMKTYDDVYWDSKLGKDGRSLVFGASGGAGAGGAGKDAAASEWLKANGAPDTPANRAAWIARNK